MASTVHQCLDCTRKFLQTITIYDAHGNLVDLSHGAYIHCVDKLGISGDKFSLIGDGEDSNNGNVAMTSESRSLETKLDECLKTVPENLAHRIKAYLKVGSTVRDRLVWYKLEQHKFKSTGKSAYTGLICDGDELVDDDEYYPEEMTEEEEKNDGNDTYEKMDVGDDNDDNGGGGDTNGNKRPRTRSNDDDKDENPVDRGGRRRLLKKWYHPTDAATTEDLPAGSPDTWYMFNANRQFSLYHKSSIEKMIKTYNETQRNRDSSWVEKANEFINPNRQLTKLVRPMSITRACEILKRRLDQLSLDHDLVLSSFKTEAAWALVPAYARAYQWVWQLNNTTNQSFIAFYITSGSQEVASALAIVLSDPTRSIITTLETIKSIILAQNNDGWIVPMFVYENVTDTDTLKMFTTMLVNTLDPETIKSIILAKNNNGWTVPMSVYYRVNDADTLKMFTTMLVNTLDTETIKSILLAQNNDGWIVPMFVYENVTDTDTLKMFTTMLVNTLDLETIKSILIAQNNDGRTVPMLLYQNVNDPGILKMFTTMLVGTLDLETRKSILLTHQPADGWIVPMYIYRYVTDDKTLQMFTTKLLALEPKTIKDIILAKNNNGWTVPMMVYHRVNDADILKMFTTMFVETLDSETIKSIILAKNNKDWTVPMLVYYYVKDPKILKQITDKIFTPHVSDLDHKTYQEIQIHIDGLVTLGMSRDALDQLVKSHKQSRYLFSDAEISTMLQQVVTINDPGTTLHGLSVNLKRIVTDRVVDEYTRGIFSKF